MLSRKLTWQPWEGWIREETGRPFEEVMVKIQRRELRQRQGQEGPSEREYRKHGRCTMALTPGWYGESKRDKAWILTVRQG